ncbi:MAG: peptidoglycan bridge formation glycyltransferase FemA/FemB family protein [Candidatus Gracilibacteria bacterium]
MNIRQLQIGDKERFNAMVAAHPYGSVEQSFEWGELQTRIPGRPAFFVFGVFEGDDLRGGMMVVRQVMGMGKTWLWCPRGPLLPAEGSEEAWELLQGAAEALARADGDVFLRIEPGYPAERAPFFGGKTSAEHYLPQDSLLLDLSLSEADLLAQMTPKGRYNIKLAEKRGVTVRRGRPEEVSVFYALLMSTAERDAFFVHEEAFYADFLRVLGDRAHFYLAFAEGEAVAGMLVTHFGSVATYYYGASGATHREKKAPYLLQWFAMREAKKAELKLYDFLGVAPEGDERHVLSGVTQFKTRFGGVRVQYTEARVFVYRRLWWWIYRVAKALRR